MAEPDDQAVMLFGYDIRKVPCFRNTFLYGISSGVGVGLLAFMFTSKPMLASHCGFVSYLTISLGYLVQCRIRHFNEIFKSVQIQQAISEHELDDLDPKSGIIVPTLEEELKDA